MIFKAPIQVIFSTRARPAALSYTTIIQLKYLRPYSSASPASNQTHMTQQSASNSPPAAKSTPPVPRPSASVVIVNHRNEVLLVQRNPKATAFGGFHVFPGGNYDRKQDSSLAITAIRETFEESGLLLASSSSPTPPESTLDAARLAIHQQEMLFQDFMSEHKLRPDVESLLPFMKWITPVGPPKRFETQFFVTFLPQSSASTSSNFFSGERQERLPTPDGGQEVISAKFVHPTEAISLHRQGKMAFMPPQFYILSTLSDIFQGSGSTQDQRNRIQQLSSGNFGKQVINPIAKGKDEKGRTILTYEGDELRGGPKGRIHRAHLKMSKGFAGEITLHRNFNIFTDFESANNMATSKL